MDIADDDDDDYPGFMGRAWADDDADDLGVSITRISAEPEMRRGGGVADDDGSNARAAGDDESDDDGDAANMWIDAATEMRKRIDDRERADMEPWDAAPTILAIGTGLADDIIADAGASVV